MAEKHRQEMRLVGAAVETIGNLEVEMTRHLEIDRDVQIGEVVEVGDRRRAVDNLPSVGFIANHTS